MSNRKHIPNALWQEKLRTISSCNIGRIAVVASRSNPSMEKSKYGDLFETGKTAETFSVGGATVINLFEKTNVPLGLSLAYGYASIPNYTAAQHNAKSMFNARLAYTGSDRFVISFDVTSFTAPHYGESTAKTRVFNYSVNINILICQ